MRIDSVEYSDFRNIASARVELSGGVNIFIGANGAGKTSALEGMHLFAHGRSFRARRDSELVRFGSVSASLSMRFSDSKRQNEAEYKLDLVKKKRYCRLNGVDITRLSEFIGALRAVLFCPQDLRLVSDGPALRRQFVDSALSQLYPAYVSLLQRYNDILAQRNALLRAASERRGDRKVNLDTLAIWSEQLAQASAKVAARREAYVSRLDIVMRELLSDMTLGTERVALHYEKAQTEEEYLHMLTSCVEREVRVGTTIYGAHRDDIAITLCGRDARAFSSQGQQRSIALAMKLAEGMLSREETGEYPVFLLDDIFSELDDSRKQYLAQGLSGRQVVITSCDRIKTDGAKVFSVSNGGIAEE
jgi:recF protein